MICFQNRTFDILNTAAHTGVFANLRLWFAFKIVPLIYWIQQAGTHKRIRLCCDLLSKSYLWYIEYSFSDRFYPILCVVICFQNRTFDILNTAVPIDDPRPASCDLLSKSYLWYIEYSYITNPLANGKVVICFQNRTFDILNTACSANIWQEQQLWFAFKIVPLIYWIQPTFTFAVYSVRCDLLSKSYLWYIEYSWLCVSFL